MTAHNGPGASPQDWAHFDLALELGEDLLPVVSNLSAKISPASTLKDLGKTPSRYNASGAVAGIDKWTELKASAAQRAVWSQQPDYGICLQTRHVRALDIDVPDAAKCEAIQLHVYQYLHKHLPMRFRADTGKVLLAFKISGDIEYRKRSFHTDGGLVEFLATGQQFIAVGTNPSGARYEWRGGLPNEFPTIALEDFEGLWESLVERFAIAKESHTASAPTKALKLKDAIARDPVAQYMIDKGLAKNAAPDGRLDFTCPFEDEHTADSGDSSTSYWPRNTGGYANGHFLCLHAHCEHRTDQEFLDGIGYIDAAMLSEFDAIVASTELPPQSPASSDMQSQSADMSNELSIISDSDTPADGGNLTVTDATELHPPFDRKKGMRLDELMKRPRPEWVVKRIIPKAELVTVIGPPGSGKSFWVWDLAMCVARGIPWRDHKVKQGGVCYIAAEGGGAFRNRVEAYCQHNNVAPGSLNVRFWDYAWNMMEKSDALALAQAIVDGGKPSIIIIDTLSASTPGANENTGEDMGKALAHFKGIHRATGAVIILIHHTGKDTSKGARGWSGINAAADAAIEIARVAHDREATITKQKDGEDGLVYGFKLEKITLALDEDEEEITSCYVVHTNDTLKDKREESKSTRYTVREQAVIDYLKECGIQFPDVNTVIDGAKGYLPPPKPGSKNKNREFARIGFELLTADGRLEFVEGGKERVVNHFYNPDDMV